jgi:pyruvate dehydrogenase E2 component (dihydrolipoamide acetyltransferase)
MSKIMTMPKIGVNMTEAQIIEWLVREGDSVKAGDLILTAETDKAVQEIASEMDGVVEKLLAAPGQVVQCQEPILVFAEPGTEAAAAPKSPGGPESASVKPAGTAVGGGASGTTSLAAPGAVDGSGILSASKAGFPRPGRARISPLAKKIARGKGVPVAELQPAREGDRIVKADVLRYRAGRETARKETGGDADKTALSGSVIPVTGIRKAVAERLSLSARTAVRSVLFMPVDAEALVERRNRLKQAGVKASYTDIIAYNTARLLRDFPIINSRWTDRGIELAVERNIGIAVDTEKGLTVPVIHGADGKSLEEIVRESAEKIARAREGKLKAEDIRGGTFTITNLGMFEVETFIPVINPPECAILGVGTVRKEPVVRGDSETPGIGWILRLSLAFDHRIVDGAPAARFLQALKRELQKTD